MGKRQVVNAQLTKLSASWPAETDKRRVGLLLHRDGRVALEHTTIATIAGFDDVVLPLDGAGS